MVGAVARAFVGYRRKVVPLDDRSQMEQAGNRHNSRPGHQVPDMSD